MHATLIPFTFRDGNAETHRQLLESEILPRASANPGFVSGYWLAVNDDEAMAVVVYNDEHAATVARDRVVAPPGIEFKRIDVCEVLASA